MTQSMPLGRSLSTRRGGGCVVELGGSDRVDPRRTSHGRTLRDSGRYRAGRGVDRMKRSALLRHLRKHGCVLTKEGLPRTIRSGDWLKSQPAIAIGKVPPDYQFRQDLTESVRHVRSIERREQSRRPATPLPSVCSRMTPESPFPSRPLHHRKGSRTGCRACARTDVHCSGGRTG